MFNSATLRKSIRYIELLKVTNHWLC